MKSEHIDAILATAVVSVLATAIWAVTGPNRQEWSLADGTVASGSNQGVRGLPPRFSSMAFGSTSDTAEVRSTLRLHVRGRSFVLRDVTPADVRAAGFEVQTPGYAAESELHAFLGYGDQNRAGGLELTFIDGRLRRFLGHCSDTSRCDFELSWPGKAPFRLPMAATFASDRFPPVVAVKTFWGP